VGIRAIKPRGKVNRFATMPASAYRTLGREDDLRQQIVDYLALHSIICSITDSGLIVREGEATGRAVMQPGWPDITGVLPGGRFLAIELKSRDGRLRPAQVSILNAMRKAGGLVIVARSLTEVIEAIESEMEKA
jgi:hypothetical protein